MDKQRSIAKVVSKLVSQSLRHIFSLTGSVFLILLGISLLQIETSLETLSAITISGILFLLLGLSGIIEFIFRIIKRYWQEYYTKPPTIKPLRQIDLPGSETGPTNDPQTVCPMCNESYPQTTIHDVCIMCGAQLESDHKD